MPEIEREKVIGMHDGHSELGNEGQGQLTENSGQTNTECGWGSDG